MALPLLRTADLLITHCFSDPADGHTDDAAPTACPASAAAAEGRLLALVQAIRNEARGCADLARLTSAATALCHAAGRGPAVRTEALPSVLALLASRYPKVRFRPLELRSLLLDVIKGVLTDSRVHPQRVGHRKNISVPCPKSRHVLMLLPLRPSLVL